MLSKFKSYITSLPHSVWSCISGALLGIGFIVPFFWFAAFGGVTLILFVLEFSRTKRESFVQGYLVGIVLYLFVLGGIAFGVYPLDWFGVSDPIYQVLAIGIIWAGAAIVFGFCIGLCSVAIKILTTNSWFDVFLFPSLWVLFEWCTSFVFYGVFFGPGSLFGPHFTLGWVGYLLAEDPVFLQGAQLGGVYFLSFILVSIGTLFFKFLHSKTSQGKKMYGRALFVLFGLWFLLHIYSFVNEFSPQAGTFSREISVAVVSRYMPPTLEQDEQFQIDRYTELLKLVSPLRNIDLLVFPENTTFLRMFLNSDFKDDVAILQHVGLQGKVPMIVDSEDILKEDGFLYSQVAFYNGEQSVFSYKQFLLPFGEHLPYNFRFLLRLFTDPKLYTEITLDRNYVPGVSIANAVVQGITIAVRFCDESMSPELYRRQVSNGADVLVNISSLSWFHGSHVVYEQMKRIAKVRAVENGRWYIQSGNMSPAFILDQKGRVVVESRFGAMEVLQAKVQAHETRTPFTILGSNIVLCCLYILLVRCLFLSHLYPYVHKKR